MGSGSPVFWGLETLTLLQPCNHEYSLLRRDVKHIERYVGTPARFIVRFSPFCPIKVAFPPFGRISPPFLANIPQTPTKKEATTMPTPVAKHKAQKAAAEFAAKWRGIGDEKQHTHKFWAELLQNIFGIEKPFEFMTFEDKVALDDTSVESEKKNRGYIDITIPETHVMIEQKSLGKDLAKAIKQSDGTFSYALSASQTLRGGTAVL